MLSMFFMFLFQNELKYCFEIRIWTVLKLGSGSGHKKVRIPNTAVSEFTEHCDIFYTVFLIIMPTFIEIPPALSGCNLQYCAKKIIYTGCLHTSWRVLQTNFPIFAQGKSRELEMLPGTILLMGFNPTFLCHFQQTHVSSDKIDVF